MMRLSALLFVAILVAGCATSTAPGAVGVTRPQLMIVPSAAINEKAATAYMQLSADAMKSGRLNTDPVLSARVKSVADRLIKQTGSFRPDAQSWRWEVNVIQSDKLNAFCMPGGKIAVSSGLVTRLELTDSEIAAVVGHEISHALREHSREKMSQDSFAAAIVQGIANSGSRNAGSAALLTGLGAKFFVQLPYSREMESESDAMGLELMARAGYDPRLAIGFWVKMQAQSQGGNATDFFSTHPSDDKRLTNLQALAPSVLPLYQAALLKNQPGQAVVATVTAESPQPPVQQAIAMDRRAADVATLVPAATATVLKPEASLLRTAPSSALVVNATPSPAGSERKAAGTVVIGRESFQVERSARAQACNASPVAALTDKGPGLETYEVACTSGKPLLFRCEFSNCVALN